MSKAAIAEKASKVKQGDKSDFKYKTVKKVTGLEFLVIETGKPVFVRFNSQITIGTMKKKPSASAQVTDLETGEIKKMLLGKVLQNQLLESYGDDGFVGKNFRIEKGEKVKGGDNEYFEFEIEEIEV